MIAHGHGDVKYAHYALDLYPADSNHTIGSFARLLRNLEKPSAYSSGLLFEDTGSTPLYEVVLDGKDVCLHSLPDPPSEPVVAKKLPPLCVCNWIIVQRTIKVDMYLHIDHCWLQKAFSRRFLCPSFW
jgi:hypothetical protein